MRATAVLTAALSLPWAASAASAAAAAGAHTHSPYAGQQSRAIKALSDAEVAALKDGAGAGFAKAAELNGYPGPTHVLELAGPLQLDARQREATQRLMTEHRARARRLGAELIDAEAELDRLFAYKRADAQQVDAATQRIGALQARLRAEHLNTHLAQTSILSEAQVRRYAALRGYAPVAGGPAAQGQGSGSGSGAAPGPGQGHAHEHGRELPRGVDAIGVPGDKRKVSRTIEIDMNDQMRFVPAVVVVRAGETVRFRVRNSGRVRHEFALGTPADLSAHHEQMKKTPEMAHAEPNIVSVAPGETATLVWRFPQVGQVGFACLQAGHYDAGMTGRVEVRARADSAKS